MSKYLVIISRVIHFILLPGNLPNCAKVNYLCELYASIQILNASAEFALYLVLQLSRMMFFYRSLQEILC